MLRILLERLIPKTALINSLLSRFILGVFIAVSVFGIYICTGLFMKMAMPMDSGIHSSSSFDCLYIDMSEPGLCPMSAVQHIASLQQLFAAVISSDFLGLLALLVVLVVSIFVRALIPYSTSPPLAVIRCWLYQKRQASIRLYNYFLTIFSQGILQPKLFA